MDKKIYCLIEVVTDLKNELDAATEKAESNESFYKWWKEADKEKDELQKKNDALIDENRELREKIEDLETQLEELSQANLAAGMLTDSNAKGVL